MTGMPIIPVVCCACGQRGAVNKVTAGLTCRCGSTDIDLDDGGAKVAVVHEAYPKGPYEGWDKEMPSKTRGWSDYEGPEPGANPTIKPPVNDNMMCPSCHGAGYDISDKTLCRMCNGKGVVRPTTGRPDVESYDATTSGPPVGGARWQGNTASVVTQGTSVTATVTGPVQISGGGGGGVTVIAGRTSYPESAEYQNRHGAPGYTLPEERFTDRSKNVDYREDRNYSAPTKPYQMNEASCPNCGHRPTELRKDRDEDAWWHCPNCGPLANIDKHPEINPYDTAGNQGMRPDRSMKTSRLIGRTKKTGKLLDMIDTITATNQGLPLPQAISLARKALATHPEG